MAEINSVLLVGLGSIGKRHMANLKCLLPHAKLSILRSQKKSNEIEDCVVVSNIEDALALRPQLAFICTPSSFHLGIGIQLAEAGIHLFIEKPLSNNLEGVREFEEAVQRSNIKVMVGYNLRFSPTLCMFRDILEKGEYGRPLCVSAEVGQYLPDWRPNMDYRSAVSSQFDLGGGVLLELSHELDYLSWLFGKPTSVFGKMLKVSDLDIDVEDLVLAQVCFKYKQYQLNGSIQLDFLQRKPYRVCKVVCEKANIIWNGIEDSVEVHQNDGVTVALQGEKNRNHTYEREIIEFINCIERDLLSPIPLKESVKVLEIIKAIKLSSDSERVIYL